MDTVDFCDRHWKMRSVGKVHVEFVERTDPVAIRERKAAEAFRIKAREGKPTLITKGTKADGPRAQL